MATSSLRYVAVVGVAKLSGQFPCQFVGMARGSCGCDGCHRFHQTGQDADLARGGTIVPLGFELGLTRPQEITVENARFSRTVDRIAELFYGWCAQQMEDAMCYAKDYRFFDDQKKAEDTRVVQERRAGLIARLLNAANKQGEKTEAEKPPVKGVAPAK